MRVVPWDAQMPTFLFASDACFWVGCVFLAQFLVRNALEIPLDMGEGSLGLWACVSAIDCADNFFDGAYFGSELLEIFSQPEQEGSGEPILPNYFGVSHLGVADQVAGAPDDV